MKRATIFLLAICIGVFSLTGCGISSHKKHEQGSVIYSFSGEDDSISVSNGVIVLDAKEETLYGGDFEYKKVNLTVSSNILPQFILNLVVKEWF